MKEILQPFAAYNVWAHQRLIDYLNALPNHILFSEAKSSFSSIYLTLHHMWYAESVWWQRLKLVENVVSPQLQGEDAQAVMAGLLKQSQLWEEWVNKSTETALQHVFEYRNSKKETFKQPVFQVLVHLFNHQSYHRGQVVTMLRQLGQEKIPATDFIEFSRRKR